MFSLERKKRQRCIYKQKDPFSLALKGDNELCSQLSSWTNEVLALKGLALQGEGDVLRTPRLKARRLRSSIFLVQ
jgi:hypothetical protein